MHSNNPRRSRALANATSESNQHPAGNTSQLFRELTRPMTWNGFCPNWWRFLFSLTSTIKQKKSIRYTAAVEQLLNTPSMGKLSNCQVLLAHLSQENHKNSGDQRQDVKDFLCKMGIVKEENCKIHGFYWLMNPCWWGRKNLHSPKMFLKNTHFTWHTYFICGGISLIFNLG